MGNLTSKSDSAGKYDSPSQSTAPPVAVPPLIPITFPLKEWDLHSLYPSHSSSSTLPPPSSSSSSSSLLRPTSLSHLPPDLSIDGLLLSHSPLPFDLILLVLSYSDSTDLMISRTLENTNSLRGPPARKGWGIGDKSYILMDTDEKHQMEHDTSRYFSPSNTIKSHFNVTEWLSDHSKSLFRLNLNKQFSYISSMGGKTAQQAAERIHQSALRPLLHSNREIFSAKEIEESERFFFFLGASPLVCDLNPYNYSVRIQSETIQSVINNQFSYTYEKKSAIQMLTKSIETFVSKSTSASSSSSYSSIPSPSNSSIQNNIPLLLKLPYVNKYNQYMELHDIIHTEPEMNLSWKGQEDNTYSAESNVSCEILYPHPYAHDVNHFYRNNKFVLYDINECMTAFVTAYEIVIYPSQPMNIPSYHRTESSAIHRPPNWDERVYHGTIEIPRRSKDVQSALEKEYLRDLNATQSSLESREKSLEIKRQAKKDKLEKERKDRRERKEGEGKGYQVAIDPQDVDDGDDGEDIAPHPIAFGWVRRIVDDDVIFIEKQKDKIKELQAKLQAQSSLTEQFQQGVDDTHAPWASHPYCRLKMSPSVFSSIKSVGDSHTHHVFLTNDKQYLIHFLGSDYSVQKLPSYISIHVYKLPNIQRNEDFILPPLSSYESDISSSSSSHPLPILRNTSSSHVYSLIQKGFYFAFDHPISSFSDGRYLIQCKKDRSHAKGADDEYGAEIVDPLHILGQEGVDDGNDGNVIFQWNVHSILNKYIIPASLSSSLPSLQRISLSPILSPFKPHKGLANNYSFRPLRSTFFAASNHSQIIIINYRKGQYQFVTHYNLFDSVNTKMEYLCEIEEKKEKKIFSDAEWTPTADQMAEILIRKIEKQKEKKDKEGKEKKGTVGDKEKEKEGKGKEGEKGKEEDKDEKTNDNSNNNTSNFDIITDSLVEYSELPTQFFVLRVFFPSPLSRIHIQYQQAKDIFGSWSVREKEREKEKGEKDKKEKDENQDPDPVVIPSFILLVVLSTNLRDVSFVNLFDVSRGIFVRSIRLDGKNYKFERILDW